MFLTAEELGVSSTVVYDEARPVCSCDAHRLSGHPYWNACWKTKKPEHGLQSIHIQTPQSASRLFYLYENDTIKCSCCQYLESCRLCIQFTVTAVCSIVHLEDRINQIKLSNAIVPFIYDINVYIINTGIQQYFIDIRDGIVGKNINEFRKNILLAGKPGFLAEYMTNKLKIKT